MKLFPLHILPNDTTIDFMRWRHVAMAVTIAVFLASVAIIGIKGFTFALDFTGGTLIEARFDRQVDVEEVRSRLEANGFEGTQVQSFGGNTDVLIRLAPHGEHAPGTGAASAEDKATGAAVLKAITTSENPATILRNEFVGPQIGKDLAMNGLYATIFMLAGFLIYIGFRFEWKFAVTASIVALFDLLVTLAYVSLMGREFDLNVLAGLLSVMGFAINDIIVVFDRVRENFRSLRVEPLEVLNRSINQTLSRTVITAVMFFLSALALYMYGGASMEGLAETHMVGAVIVVLSSILVAVPMLTIGFLRVSKQDLLPKAKDVEALARRP
ncbi:MULTISPECIES: protein translocase subunit SecF [Stenotrophomonas]|uniref:Protein-export membrane protein SecF n=1 Tax=Stenotrophomonas aracearum TaxID=3003272 RepID=A0ABY9YHL0_9GAMM|nr:MULTISPECIES: protein translocase subunit SecF [Stenotrophomonas]OEZ02365.1 protein-export membrane protein SecF [Stenotrophomonas sp. BIIR7]WNH50197.1 protein translocase subunit SecF [Stenotrophomonas sp. A5588]